MLEKFSSSDTLTTISYILASYRIAVTHKSGFKCLKPEIVHCILMPSILFSTALILPEFEF